MYTYLGLVPESLGGLVNLQILALNTNNFDGGYEDEVWHLPVKDQLLYWGMSDLEAIAADAAKRGHPKTVKFIAMNKRSDVILHKAKDSASTVLALLVQGQALLTYQMLAAVPVAKSEELMYRRYREMIYLDNGSTNRDLVGETFEYPTPDGEYCIQGSDKKYIRRRLWPIGLADRLFIPIG